MIVLRFADGDSVMTVSYDNGYLNIQRPNKGMTPKLKAIAERFLNKQLLGKDEAKVKTFIEQTDNLSVLIGEERCG